MQHSIIEGLLEIFAGTLNILHKTNYVEVRLPKAILFSILGTSTNLQRAEIWLDKEKSNILLLEGCRYYRIVVMMQTWGVSGIVTNRFYYVIGAEEVDLDLVHTAALFVPKISDLFHVYRYGAEEGLYFYLPKDRPLTELSKLLAQEGNYSYPTLLKTVR
jgi:hypothetical protein